MRRRRQKPTTASADTRAQLAAVGLTEEQVVAIDAHAQACAREAAAAEVASLAGLVLQHVSEAGPDKKDPAHRTSGALDLADSITAAFGERLEQADS